MPTSPRLLFRRAVAVATVTCLVAVSLSGCFALASPDGDDLAHDAADQLAAQIASHSQNDCGTTLEEMAAFWVPDQEVYLDPGTGTAVPLAWEGRVCTGTEATIDVRVHVAVEAETSSQLFGRSHGPGEATRCFRLVWEQYEEAHRSEIPCPDGPAPARPTPPPRPELTQADRDTVATIVAATPDLADIETALLDAFPQDYVRLQAELFEGEVVVALGIPEERECILVVRHATGEVSFPDFRRISLEPGETGCATDLYTNPPF